MRESLFIVLLCLGFTGSVAAQTSEQDEFSLKAGLKVGFNNSNVWDERDHEAVADSKIGLAGGMFLFIPVGNVIGLQPELLISQKGYRHSYDFSGSSYFFRRTATYLDIPLQVFINPGELFTLVAGPQYSYLLHQKDRHNYDESSQPEFDIGNVRQSSFGFTGGVDFEFKQFVFSFRLMWDLLEHDGDSSTPRYRNQSAQFTVGYKLL
ncbi:MAG: porin family protein [Balneolaceae bacterium]